MNTKRVALYFLGQILSIAITGVVMFWSAGRMDWWAAWAVIAVWLVWFTAVDLIIFRSNPDLLAERLAPPKESKGWDKAILSILRLTELARYIIAGLDQRYGWTSGFPVAAQIVAWIVCFLCTALFAWAMYSNAYFSQVVRIQADRGHAVVTQGPYHYIRHPGYLSTILFDPALSVLLASWWAIVAGVLCSILLILRTALEDRTLQRELAGYADYVRQVRYRLLPSVW